MTNETKWAADDLTAFASKVVSYRTGEQEIVARCDSKERAERFASCGNALATIPDPAAFVQAARGVFSSLAAAEATGLLEHGGIGEIIRADLEAFRAATGEA